MTFLLFSNTLQPTVISENQDKKYKSTKVQSKSEVCATSFNTTVLSDIISTIDMNNKVYLMGDYNIDILKHRTSGPIENFCNLMYSKNLHPCITRPT